MALIVQLAIGGWGSGTTATLDNPTTPGNTIVAFGYSGFNNGVPALPTDFTSLETAVGLFSACGMRVSYKVITDTDEEAVYQDDGSGPVALAIVEVEGIVDDSSSYTGTGDHMIAADLTASGGEAGVLLAGFQPAYPDYAVRTPYAGSGYTEEWVAFSGNRIQGLFETKEISSPSGTYAPDAWGGDTNSGWPWNALAVLVRSFPVTSPAVAAGTGAAYDPSISLAPHAELAQGVGEAFTTAAIAGTDVFALAEAAQGSGAAYPAGIIVRRGIPFTATWVGP